MAIQPFNAHSPIFSPHAVGQAFVDYYYKILQKYPHRVPRFYTEASRITRNDGDVEICQDVMALEYGNFKVEMITSIHSKELIPGCWQVMVTGSLFTKLMCNRDFVQTFVLAKKEIGYFVLNDIFRYVDKDESPMHRPPQVAAYESPQLYQGHISTRPKFCAPSKQDGEEQKTSTIEVEELCVQSQHYVPSEQEAGEEADDDELSVSGEQEEDGEESETSKIAVKDEKLSSELSVPRKQEIKDQKTSLIEVEDGELSMPNEQKNEELKTSITEDDELSVQSQLSVPTKQEAREKLKDNELSMPSKQEEDGEGWMLTEEWPALPTLKKGREMSKTCVKEADPAGGSHSVEQVAILGVQDDNCVEEYSTQDSNQARVTPAFSFASILQKGNALGSSVQVTTHSSTHITKHPGSHVAKQHARGAAISLAERCCVYVRNLSLGISTSQLKEEFKKFGLIRAGGVDIKRQKQGVCYAFVEFEEKASVETAIRASPISIDGHWVYIEQKKHRSNTL